MFQTRFLLITSWITAAILATPQLFAWGTMDVFPDWPGGWIQCFLVRLQTNIYNIFEALGRQNCGHVQCLSHIFCVLAVIHCYYNCVRSNCIEIATIVDGKSYINYWYVFIEILHYANIRPIGRIVTDTASAVVTEPLISAKCRATDSEIKTPGATNLNLLMMVAPGQTLTLPLNGKDEQSAVDFDENGKRS